MLPLVVQIDRSLLEGPNDGSATIRHYWAAEQQGVNPFNFERDVLVGAPEGLPHSSAPAIANAVQPAFVWSLKPLIGLVASWNVFILLGFVLSGVTMFIALDKLRLGFWSALFGATVFAFNPWHVEKAAVGHGGLVHTWILPLFLVALLRTRRTERLRDAAAAGLVLAGAFYLHTYLGLLGLVMLAVFVAVDVARRRSWTERLWSITLLDAVWVVALLALAPALLVFAREGAAAAVGSRSVADLQLFGAAPLAYLVPSERHPVFGDLVAGLWSAGDTRHFAEPTLFFGYSTLGLAAIALVLGLRGHWRRDPTRRFALWFAAALVPVAFVTSLPRLVEIGGVSLPTPAYFIGELTTVWRVYARVGVLVGLGLVVLGSIALHAILRRTRFAPLVGMLALGIVSFELVSDTWADPWRTDAVPAHVEWLARQPSGIVAHYPMLMDRPAEDLMEAREYFYQVHHGHPLYWPYSLDLPELRTVALRVFSKYPGDDPEAVGVLAAQGVRYVVFHHDVYRALGRKAPRPAGLVQMATFPGVSIYRVDAAPMSIESLLSSGGRRRQVAEVIGIPAVQRELGEEAFDPPELKDGLEWRWMRQDGKIHVYQAADVPQAKYELVARAFSASRPRTLLVLDETGTVLANATVTTQDTELRAGPFTLPPGKSTLTLRVVPGPEPLGDGRIRSIFVGPASVEAYLDFDRPLAGQ